MNWAKEGVPPVSLRLIWNGENIWNVGHEEAGLDVSLFVETPFAIRLDIEGLDRVTKLPQIALS
jgi:hypothetical protein